jgi:hypothetical protein
MKKKSDSNVLAIGFTTEELREEVIERAAAKLVESYQSDENRHYSRMDGVIRSAVEQATTAYIEKTVMPIIQRDIASITMQATNTWGEKTGKAQTFREYLVDRATKWLQEEVNYEGKPKGTDSYSWKAYQTRVAHMVHQHIHHEI